DDERQTGLARSRNMGAETFDLLGSRAMLVVEIQPGFTDADYLGVVRGLDQPVGAALPLHFRLVRMDAHRAPDIGVPFGDRPHLVELVEPRADGQHARNSGRTGARQHAGLVARKLGEVEVAVAVDQHHAAALGSTKRGNTPCGFGKMAPGFNSLSKAENTLPSAG